MKIEKGTKPIIAIVTVAVATLAFLSLGFFAIDITNDAYAQTSEQNEKFIECQEFREKTIPNNSNGWLVNCIEYGNSDYDTIEEFLSEEHPELKLTAPE